MPDRTLVGAEVWQLAGVAAVGVSIVTLWVLLVYRPRRTGEGTPPLDPSEKKEGTGPE